MKASSERYKSESRIAVGYVNRMQILAVVYIAKKKLGRSIYTIIK